MGIIENKKQFLLIVLVWFIFSYLVLWFIGGACLNPLNGQNCLALNTLSGLRNVPFVGLLLPYDAWSSLMYFFAPLAGFVLAFVLIKWWNGYFETNEAAGIGFLALIILALFVGYFINLSIYVGEGVNSASGRQAQISQDCVAVLTYSLNPYLCFFESTYDSCSSYVTKLNSEFVSAAQQACLKTKQVPLQQYITPPVYYWSELRRSMYLLFIFGAIAAWVPLFVRGIYVKYAQSK